MTNFNVPTREEVSPASQAAFDTIQKGLGMVPNLYAAMAYSDHALPRYLAYQSAKTSLSNKEVQAVNLVVSEINACRYCLSAHTVLGKMNGFSDEEIFNIRGGSATDAKLNALVKMTKSITENRGHVPADVLNAFLDAGYTKGSLVDVILAVTDKIAMNYLHHIIKVPIDFPEAASLESATA